MVELETGKGKATVWPTPEGYSAKLQDGAVFKASTLQELKASIEK
jgi:hypothetical protein